MINYKEYHPDWKNISKFIRFERDNNKCKWCGILNGEIGYRGNNDGSFYSVQMVEDALNNKGYDYFSNELKHYINKDGLLKRNPTKIVLTVAHIDQTKTNNDYSNLASLCQRCHLKHDMNQHVANRKKNRELKTNQISLFAEVS